MIAALAARLAGLGLPARAARPLAWATLALVGALLIWGAASLLLDRRDQAVVKRADSARQLKVERAGRAADAAIEARREARRATAEVQEEEFNRATDRLPPEGLTRRQRLDLCRELRDAGHPVLELAQCADLRAGAQADAGPASPPGR